MESIKNQIAVIQEKGQALKALDKQEAAEKVKDVIGYIHRELGITEPLTEFDQVRFVDYIRKYYSYLTLSDIKLAFELYSLGKLHGVREHYNRFSAPFYNAVLKAYIVLKGQMTLQMRLPDPGITQEQKDQLFKDFQVLMVKAFRKWRDEEVISSMTWNMTVFDLLVDRGLVEPMEMSQVDRALALEELQAEISGTYNVVTQEQKDRRAKTLSCHRAVREFYQKIKKDNKDLINFIDIGEEDIERGGGS